MKKINEFFIYLDKYTILTLKKRIFYNKYNIIIYNYIKL